MVLDRQRRRMDFLVLPLARAFGHLNPNHLTLASFAFALPAALLLWRSSPETEAASFSLVFAALLVFLHGVLDMVDGVVARMHKKETPLGDFLDHVLDRVADVLLLAAVAFSPWGDLRVGLWAIVATLLTSYLGTQAQAVGAGRMYSGFVARADRIVLLIAAPVVDHALVSQGLTLEFLPHTPYALGLVLWYIALGGAVTAAERFVRIALYLHRRPGPR